MTISMEHNHSFSWKTNWQVHPRSVIFDHYFLAILLRDILEQKSALMCRTSSALALKEGLLVIVDLNDPALESNG